MTIDTNDTTDDSAVKVTRSNGVVTVMLDRIERKNAITLEMWHELHRVLVAIGRNDNDRVVVLTGAGDAFCSGADISIEGKNDSPRHWSRRMDEINEVCLALHRLPQPTIARVNGVAAGAGMNLALGCDLIIASETARFCEIFSKRGLSVDFGGSWILPRLVGLHRAKQLVLLSEMLSAKEAAEMGLVNRVVPADELDAAVADWADRLKAGPPVALAASKRLLQQGTDSSLAAALAAEGSAQSVNFGTKDTAEALIAFAQKRSPKFTGQ